MTNRTEGAAGAQVAAKAIGRKKWLNWLAAGLIAVTAAGGVMAKRYAYFDDPGNGAGQGGGQAGVTHLNFQSPGSGPIHFKGALDRGSVLAGEDGLVRMELVLSGDDMPERTIVRRGTDLVVVLDRSGSMQGGPMTHALGAVRELIDQLSDGDRFSLVTYSSGAEIHIARGEASVDARKAWKRALDQVQVTGGTNMSAGLDLADRVVSDSRRSGNVARVILLSDGHANEGDSSFEGLRTRAARAARGEYVLSAVGVGDGFDERIMTGLADAGTGNFYYVQRSSELGEVFAGEFASARTTIAQSLVVEIEMAPGVQILSAGGYPLDRAGRLVRFRPGSIFAGQTRSIWVDLAVPTNVVTGDELGGDAGIEIGRFALDYKREGELQRLAFDRTPRVAVTANEAVYMANIDADVWAQGLIDEGLGALKQAVAQDVQAGRRDEAMKKLERFQSRGAGLNATVQSAPVAEALADIAEMEDEISEAFESKDRSRQNRIGKSYSASGQDSRRKGAKYP